MTRTVTTKAIKRIITKGLTGWEAGKLILQDFIYSYYGKKSLLTEADKEVIRNVNFKGDDVKDYNMFMALCRGFYKGCILGEWVGTDACLEITYLDQLMRKIEERRTLELFEAFGPHVVTQKQYEDIVSAQRKKKLEFEYSLGYVIEKRFYAIAPPEAEKTIEETGVDIESTKDFISVVPEAYRDLCNQAIDEIRYLYIKGKLPAVCQRKDLKKVEPLLDKWRISKPSKQDTCKLVDMFYITGQQLYDCDELPEWKEYMDRYHQYLFGDEDERFRHIYAILENCSEVWVDEHDYYKEMQKPSEWLTLCTELYSGLINPNDWTKKSIQSLGTELRDRFETTEQKIRLFLAIKTILDTAAKVVELELPGNEGMLFDPNTRLVATIFLYNIQQRALREERRSWESGETRLEKALKMLSAIDPENLKPSPDSKKQLKNEILTDAKGEEWLHTKIYSLEYEDDFNFSELL